MNSNASIKTELYRASTAAPAGPDRSAFYNSIRANDTFICSYPKSGTTWLGYLLAEAVKPDDEPALNLKSFNGYVPDVNLAYTKRGSLAAYSDFLDPRLFLCHAAYDVKLPKAVYVVRDPRDVMVSYWHYKKFLTPGVTQSLLEFIESDAMWPGRWDRHVGSWLVPSTPTDCLVVRYEDMHRDSVAVLRDVLKFANRPASEARIRSAVEAGRFEKMRAAEETHGVHGKAGDVAERFVRKGRVGSWQEEMGYAELRATERKFGDVMRAVGYAPMS